MVPEPVERKLAAILSADVVGYSRLMAEDEAATIRTLTDYREEIAMRVRQHRGRVVDAPGDNLLAEFPTALDDYLRAYDSVTGDEIWKGRLPAGGQATPLSYRVRDDGRQFVVIAAGGHNQMRSRRGDSVVAFALPK